MPKTSWPLLTIAGIAAVGIVALVHTALEAAQDCLLGADDLGPRFHDGFGPDGYQ